jgi:hypothetical protein
MNAKQLSGLAIRKVEKASEALGRKTQIVCHLNCVRKHLSLFHFNRIPFHVVGILRAIGT